MIVEFNEEFYCEVSASSFIDVGIKWMDIRVDLYRKGLKMEYKVCIRRFTGRTCEPNFFPSRYQKRIDKLIQKKIDNAKKYMQKYIQNREIMDKINNEI
jgi:hypothetical protein